MLKSYVNYRIHYRCYILNHRNIGASGSLWGIIKLCTASSSTRSPIHQGTMIRFNAETIGLPDIGVNTLHNRHHTFLNGVADKISNMSSRPTETNTHHSGTDHQDEAQDLSSVGPHVPTHHTTHINPQPLQM